MQLGSNLDEAVEVESWYTVALSSNGNRVVVGTYSIAPEAPAGRVQIYDWTGSQS